jgi:hypothetical protein
MRRDKRLLGSILLFVAAIPFALYQGFLTKSYIRAATLGQLDSFAKYLGLPQPPEFCLDFCGPELPFTAGYIAITCVVAAMLLVVAAWWKPKLW